MTFKSLIFSDEQTRDRFEKIYTKLLAFGILDFNESYKIIEKFRQKIDSQDSSDVSIDLLVYEHLSLEKIPESEFGVKHILSLTFDREVSPQKKLSDIDNMFPHLTKVSSMIPGPIHFGPLEGFLSDSFSNFDLKTLIFTIGSWMFVYGLIIYYLYF